MIVPVPVGHTEWFMPGVVHAGDVVACGPSRVSVPTLKNGETDWLWAKNKPQVSVDVAHGAVAIACGTLIPAFRSSTMPYVIGQNGLALIRGPNTLGALERVYGKPTGAQPGAGMCVVSWVPIGLHAIFRGNRCASASVLGNATVSGSRWSALAGVHVGDSVARLVWEVAAAKQLSPLHWKIATRLVAVVSNGKVTGFTAYTSR
ncbi:MAG TPA: hypothetical protein VKP14_04955 [Gaiellaceae bacterium]|nr:hypothetical protein [Gaiellaceae bacterium]